MTVTKILKLFPVFPQFQPITLGDCHVYEDFYKSFKPYSDFSFANLWIWFNQKQGLAASTFGDCLILRLDDPFTGGASEYTVLGRKDAAAAIQRIFRWQKAMNLEVKIVMVPEEVIDHLRNHDFLIEEDDNNHDYVYHVKTLAEAQGPEYAGIRRAVSIFERQYGPAIITHKELDLTSLTNRVQLVNCLHQWESAYRQDLQSRIEGTALNIHLQEGDALKPRGFGVFVGGKLVSFVIYHLAPQGKYGMLNHIKCNYELREISDFTMHAFINHLKEMGVRFENFEQDLGLMGLRKYKQSLRPDHLLKRYTVKPK